MNLSDRIDRCISQIDGLITSCAELGLQASQAEHDFKVKAASLRMGLRYSGKYTVQALDDEVLMGCEDEHLSMLTTQAKHQAARDSLRGLQAQLDGLRTLAAGARSV